MFNRAERTAEGLVVSGLCGEGSGKSASLQSIVDAVEQGNRLGFPDNPQTNFGGAGGKAPADAPAGYLEPVDNVSFEAKASEICNWLSATCDSGKGYFIVAECENGHRFAKELVCNKEWCLVCGEDDSFAHLRRFARWLPKITQIESLGYLVFTLPDEVKPDYRTKKALSKLGHQVQELLKSNGYSRGLRRWHFAGDYIGVLGGQIIGDCNLKVAWGKAFNRLVKTLAVVDGAKLLLNPNKGTIYTDFIGEASFEARLVADFAKTYGLHLKPYSSIKLNFHLNCLVDGGFISEAKLEAIKRAYARLLGVDQAVVNYHYRLSPGKMVHTLKYVTRATFRDYDWDLELAMELRGFRNMVVWGRGKWDDEPSWSLDELKGEAKAEVEGLDIGAIEALVEKRCPVCGEPVVWDEALPIGLLDMVDKTSLGAGYYRLADMRSPPGRDKYHPNYPLLGYLANIKHCRLETAKKRAEAETAIEADYQTAFWRDILKA